MNVTIQSLTTYPLKSAGGVTLPSAELEITGLPSDRRWMLVDEANRFVSQRRLPGMALLSTSLSSEGFVIRYPGHCPLDVDLSVAAGDLFRATMHRSDEPLAVRGAGEQAANWFTECFAGSGIGDLRLVRLDDGFQRPIPDRPDDSGQQVQLSDGYPFLVASQSSLDLVVEHLGGRDAGQTEMKRFRPNIVINGAGPWQEMQSNLVLVNETGTIRLRLAKPCQRCTIPQVNPDTGERDLPAELHQILKGLDGDRESPINCFGQNAILESGAGETVAVGQSFRMIQAC